MQLPGWFSSWSDVGLPPIPACCCSSPDVPQSSFYSQMFPFDASLQDALHCTVKDLVIRPENGVPLAQQSTDLLGHPGLLVGVSVDSFVHSVSTQCLM